MSIAGQSFNNNENGAYVEVGVGNAASIFNGAFTVAVLANIHTDNTGSAPLLGAYSGAINSNPNRGALLVSGGKLYGMDDFSSGFGSSALNDGVWRWYVYSKAAGAAHYRMHLANLSTLTWAHGESPGAADHGNTGTSTVFTIACAYGALSYETMDIAAVAMWTSNLSDAQIQAACTQLAADLKAASPTAGWLMPSASVGSAGSIVDFTGGGANETARHFLVATADPANYNFSTTDTFWPETTVQAAGGSRFNDAHQNGIVTSTGFTFAVDGQITAIRYPAIGAGTAATVQGGIYEDVGPGSPPLLASTAATSLVGTEGNWLTLPLTTPLNVTAGAHYRVVARTVRDGTVASSYWAQSGYFSGGSIAHGNITAYSAWFVDNVSTLAYPNDSFGGSGYFVDVVFVPTPPGGASLATTVAMTATGQVGREVLWGTASPGNVDPVETGGITTGTGVLFGAEPAQPYVASIWSADGHYVSTVNGFIGGANVGELATLYAWAHNESIAGVAPAYGTMGQAVFISGVDGLPTTALGNNYFVSPIYDEANGTVKGIKFWTSTTVSGNYRASLWKLDAGTQATGTRVASKSFTSASIAGGGQWHTVLFDTPYALGAPASDAALSSTVTLTSSGSTGKTASASLAATASIAAQGVIGAVANGSVTLAASIVATGILGDETAASLPVAASIVATAFVGRSAVADMPLGALISATGSLGVPGSVSLALSAAITAAGALDYVALPQPPADVQLRVKHVVALQSAHDVGLDTDFEVTLAWLP